MKNKPETITNERSELTNSDYLRNKVEELTAQEIDANGASIDKISNAVFLSVCDHVGRSLFGGLDISSDAVILGNMALIYTAICNRYDKIPSLEGFAYICRISPDLVKSWAQDAKSITPKTPYLEQLISALTPEINAIYIYNIPIVNDYREEPYNTSNIDNLCRGEMLTAVCGRIYERLQFCREEALKNKLLNGNQQIGAIAVANQEYKWDADKVQREERARALTLADLPKIDTYVNSQMITQTTESL